VVPCLWGDSCGSRLGADGQSIPPGRPPRSARGPLAAEETEEDALWSLIELDPLFELKLLSAAEAGGSELPPGAPSPSELIEDATAKIRADETLRGRMAEAGLGDVCGAAVRAIFVDQSVSLALSRGLAADDVWPATARAIVAECLVLADGDAGGSFPMDAATRDALVDDITAVLGGSARGIGASLGGVGLGVALRLGATGPVERRRDVVTKAVAPVTGDVALYLARGKGIRDFIGAAIRSAPPPVTVVAHSLGGVAALELLGTGRYPEAQLLITVGSQAPLLYELNALPTLPFGTPLPDGVPRWVNVFDPRDLLAFIGEKIFPGRVTDLVVDSGVPFPRAHSAYFTSPQFYAILDEVMP